MPDHLQNVNEQETTVISRDPSYHEVGQVINGPITHQTVVQAKVTRYTIEPEEPGIVALVSKILHRYVGDRSATAVAGLSTGLGILGILPELLQKPASLLSISIPLFWASVCLIVVGLGTRSALKYKAKRTCAECRSHYALEETRDAEVEDIEVKEGVRRKTSRFFKCVSCGFEEVRTDRELIED